MKEKISKLRKKYLMAKSVRPRPGKVQTKGNEHQNMTDY